MDEYYEQSEGKSKTKKMRNNNNHGQYQQYAPDFKQQK